MAQQPIQLDALQIVGDSGTGTRLISSDTLGRLVFSDPEVASATLSQLLGSLSSLTGVYVVSTDGGSATVDGNGSPMTSIQAALDAVPNTSSASNPSLILVAPGTYVEDIRIVKDGVTIQGLGDVTLQGVGSETVSVLQGVSTLPRRVRLQGLTITNSDPSGVCLGASSERFATGTVTVTSLPAGGDTLSLNGTTLTAVCSPTVPGAGQYLVGATVEETAENIVSVASADAAINSLMRVTRLGAVITVEALTTGAGGNALTLATSVPATFVLSGATLTGGLNATTGSDLLSDVLEVFNCNLLALGVTSYQVRADAVGNTHFRHVSCRGSSTGSTFSLTQCSRVELEHVTDGQTLVFGYTTAGTLIPSTAPTTYRVLFCNFANSSATYLTGVSEAEVRASRFGVLSVAGDRPYRFLNSDVEGLSVYDMAQVSLRETQYTTIAGSATATLSESGVTGTLTYTSSTAEFVTFAVPQPDADYVVLLSSDIVPGSISDLPRVTSYVNTGFTVSFPIAQTGTVRWSLTRKVA